ncbi:MAG: DMT family transporter [Clostridia bacterium]|nr:DMT family transporter [Clostridia bacterium]
MSNRNNLKGGALLLTAAFLWGVAFTAQSGAADLIPPFLCNSLRSFIAAIFLAVFLKIRKGRGEGKILPKDALTRKRLYKVGFVCGVLLLVAVNLQQFGITFYPDGAASEARAGFLTALYVLLVPIFSIFSGNRAGVKLWIAVAVSLFGFYLLCFSDGFSGVYLADLLVFGSAVAFAVHIMAVDMLGAALDGVQLSMMQFAVVGVISGVFSLFFERTTFGNVLTALPEILYLGIVSSGIAYTLQIVGQHYAEPTVASLSMSMESVFAALAGWLIMGNALSRREMLGCALVFAAIVLAQMPSLHPKKMTEKD